MCRTEDGGLRYASLCIQSIPVRLRWRRYFPGLMQKEAADLVGKLIRE
jgi:hypothetical protein